MRKRTTTPPPNTIGKERAKALLEAIGVGGKAALRMSELQALGVAGSRTTIYERIADGTLKAVKLGANTIFLVPDVIDLIASMPTVEPKRPAARKGRVSLDAGGALAAGARQVAGR
jgi:predicted DNA-binding transcriptional regulator AlpA